MMLKGSIKTEVLLEDLSHTCNSAVNKYVVNDTSEWLTMKYISHTGLIMFVERFV